MRPAGEVKKSEKTKAGETWQKEILTLIEYEDFAILDIKGKVLLAEPVKKSKKFLRVEVDIGEKKPRYRDSLLRAEKLLK